MHKNNNKIIFLDMDGTTYYKNGPIIEENKQIINKLIENNWFICFITGRPIYCEANDFSWIKNADNVYYSFYNGSLVYDFKNNKPFFSDSISNTEINYFFDKTNIFSDLILLAYSTDGQEVYSNVAKNSNVAVIKQEKVVPKKWTIIDQDQQYNNCYKILALNIEQDLVNEIIAKGYNVFYNPKSKAAEINTSKINKGKICEMLIEKLNISKEKSYCIGDSYNDVEMFKKVNNGCALNNSIEIIKNIAKYVSSFNFDNGGLVDIYDNYLSQEGN